MNDVKKRRPLSPRKAREVATEVVVKAALRGGDLSATILAEEVSAVTEQVEDETLPTDIRFFKRGSEWKGDAKTLLEGFGIKFLGPVEGDPLFQRVELPTGWKKIQRTDHHMYASLVDDKGRVRGTIFYKAALYDREAELTVHCRFSGARDYERPDRREKIVAHVKDGGNKIIWSTAAVDVPADPHEERALTDGAVAECERWLNEHYPNWRDPTAYWETP